ncbi:MAG: methionine adenosyltransferase [Deltaproteobacteria bacterium]|nr:methionine adenosyltransferase [Deltaproteobacteria bacterium]MBQ6668998.1 methionine adenosyltransferase [Deltaproteobacteria bacterium]
MADYIFSSESVTEGHPDKMCDQISDAVLDAILTQDAGARVACESLVSAEMAMIAGEVTTTALVDIPALVRKVILDIGYNDSAMGFDGNSCAILVALGRQSPDISQGVTAGEGLFKEQGAGDQGIMFGYACRETPELMPMPIIFAHRLTQRLAEARREGVLPFLRPDGKSQVSVEYRDGRPVRVDTVVMSSQHTDDVAYETIKEGIIEEVIRKTIPEELLDSRSRFLVNPTGKFVVGGPKGDCGLTGRKIIVDTYGGASRHGGGAFSGKDPSKVDRSAAYMARYIAKNVVAAGLAERCELQIAYAIGVAEPVSVMVQTFGTEAIAPERIAQLIRENFDLRPAEIIRALDLRRPIYRQTAAYGHFGRELPGFSWERTDRAETLRKQAGC